MTTPSTDPETLRARAAEIAHVRREILERTRNMMGTLADLREAVDLDDQSSAVVLSYCDDLETAAHNIGAAASHLPADILRAHLQGNPHDD